MHEVGLMQEAMKIVMSHAEREHAERVRSVRMRVGEDSGVVPVSLSFAFGVVTQNTIAQGARLEIEQTPVTCLCPYCNEEFTPRGVFYDCPKCGKTASEVTRGHELEVVSIEVD